MFRIILWSKWGQQRDLFFERLLVAPWSHLERFLGISLSLFPLLPGSSVVHYATRNSTHRATWDSQQVLGIDSSYDTTEYLDRSTPIHYTSLEAVSSSPPPPATGVSERVWEQAAQLQRHPLSSTSCVTACVSVLRDEGATP